MIKNLRTLILSGQFLKAQEVASQMSFKDMENLLLELAYETESIALYSFVFSLLIETENSDLHYLASELLTQPLCHIEGAYQAGYFHAKKAIELSPDDIQLQEYLLLFYEIPESLLSKEEAVILAHKILVRNPNSQVALNLLGTQT